MSDPLVYILILNWNSKDKTIDCLNALRDLDYSNYKIVIIDNGSQDGSESFFKMNHPEHFFIQTGKNQGYAGGNNYGIRLASSHGADYVWILNPDTLVSSDSLRLMITATENDPRVGVCGPRIQNYKEPCVQLIAGFSLFPELGYYVEYRVVNETSNITVPTIENVDFVIGCSMLIKMEVLKKTGLLREDFFIYYEEVEFSLRARSMGWISIICNQACDRHFSVGQDNLKKYYFLYRNPIILSRIQNKYVFKAIRAVLGTKKIRVIYGKTGAIEAIKHTLIILLAVIAGLMKPLREIPKL